MSAAERMTADESSSLINGIGAGPGYAALIDVLEPREIMRARVGARRANAVAAYE